MDARADLPIGSEPLPYRQRHIASTGLSATRGPLSAGCRFTYKSGIGPAPGLFPEGTRDLIPAIFGGSFTGLSGRKVDRGAEGP